MNLPADDNITNERRPNIMKRVVRKIHLMFVKSLSSILPQRIYMQLFTRILRYYGMNIIGLPLYIDPSCRFDVLGFDRIIIEEHVVISANVCILVHDFSISRVRDALAGKYFFPEIAIARGVHIKRNSFIGFGSILLPGTEIGENCIVGAGSVVRGKVQDGMIVAGNPACIVGDTLEWGRLKLKRFEG